MELEKKVMEFQNKLAKTQSENSEVLKILNEIKSSSLKSKLVASELSYLEKLMDVYSKYAVVLLGMINIPVDSWAKESFSFESVLGEISEAASKALRELSFLQEELNK
ncbi:TPA: hypothetical protein RQN23_002899 [Aeromonas veronii]|nr:hypothetical protein [Aeromonas veronii]